MLTELLLFFWLNYSLKPTKIIIIDLQKLYNSAHVMIWLTHALQNQRQQPYFAFIYTLNLSQHQRRHSTL